MGRAYGVETPPSGPFEANYDFRDEDGVSSALNLSWTSVVAICSAHRLVRNRQDLRSTLGAK